MATKTPPNPWAAVGRAVRDARTRRGWSQQTLASKAEVSLSTVTALETAKRTSYQMMKVGSIWRALGLPTSELNGLLDKGGISPVEDAEIGNLREHVEASGLSERTKQTILHLIETEASKLPTPAAAKDIPATRRAR